MAGGLTLDAVLNLSLGSILRGREAEREIADIMGDASAKGAAEGLKEGTKKASGALEATWTKLLQSSMRKQGDELKKAYTKAARIQEKSADELADVQQKLSKIQATAEKARLLARKAELTKEIKRQETAQKRLLKVASQEADKRMDLIEQHEARMSKSKMDAAKEGGEAFQDAVGKAMSMDSMDPSSFVESLFKGLSGAAEAGAGAAGASGASGAAGALTSVAGGLAAVAAPLALLVGVIGAAFGQTKDLNKALLESVTAADMLGENRENISLLNAEYGALNVRLKMLRRVTIDAAYDFRMSKEEVTGYIGALNEAGLTVSEFRGVVTEATNDMQAYEAVTRTAILASQGLGISASETGDFMNKMTRDLGADLTSVQGAFGMIYSEATKAKMSTKDFFAAINEASSGMALYNFRVGDTVGLFKDLVEILGEDLAKQTIGMEGTYRQMGMQQRTKDTMLRGTGTTQKIVTADAMAQAKVFAATLSEKGINIPELGDITSLEGLKNLGGMTGPEYRAIYSKVSDPAAKRQLESMRDLAKGMKGGLLNVAQATGAVSKTGELALSLSQGQALGIKELADASPMQVMQMQEALGISGDQWETLKRLDTGLRAEFEAMQTTAKVGDEIVGKTFEEALAGGLLSQSKTLEEQAGDQYTLMERSAQEQLMETRSMSQTLSNIIADFLENIWLGVEHLGTLVASLIPFGNNDSDLRRQSIRAERSAQVELEGLGGQIVAKQGAIGTEKDPAKKAALKEEQAALEKQAKDARKRADIEKQFRENLQGGANGVEALSKAVEMVNRDDLETRFGEGATERGQALFGSSAMAKNPDAMAQVLGKDVSELPTFSGSGNVNTAQLWDELSPKEQTEATEKLLELEELAQSKQAKETGEVVGATEDSADLIVNTMRQIQQEQDYAKLYALLEESGIDTDSIDAAFAAASAGDSGPMAALLAQGEGGTTGTESALAKSLGFKGIRADTLPPVEDFIYRGDGRKGDITPIDKADQFFGAKPGGPISGGGSKTVYISINGGDEARVYEIVSKVLKESGYSDMRSY